MKHVLITILLFISITAYSQTDSLRINFSKAPAKTQYSKGTTILLFASSIILNAVGDGLNDSKQKTIGHICNAANIAALIAIPFICNVDKKKWYIYVLSYTSLRIGLFDPSYNVARGLDINYVGCTSPTDKEMRKHDIQSNLFYRGFFIGIGIALPLWGIK